MALPGNDPYKDGAPTITSWTSGQQIDRGHNYDGYIVGTNLSTWCRFKSIISATDYWGEYTLGYPDPTTTWTDSCVNGFTRLYLDWDSSSGIPGGGDDIVVYNPILYTLETPPHIMLAVSHYHCGIAEADIDVTSFDNVHTWANTNNLFRSVAFLEKSCLAIFKHLMETSAGIYIYINGSNQLACGYTSFGDPSTPADWEIDNSDVISWKAYGKITDRQVPEKVKCGYRWWACPMGEPRHPRFEDEYGSGADAHNIMPMPLMAEYLDPVNKEDDDGQYVDLYNFIELTIEVKGGKGFVMDIDETVKVTNEALGLSIDNSFPDIFLVQKIVRKPITMTAEVTMIKYYTWNDGI